MFRRPKVLSPTQQSRDVNPMTVQCWPTVCDAGPALKQLWVNVSCLLGRLQPRDWHPVWGGDASVVFSSNIYLKIWLMVVAEVMGDWTKWTTPWSLSIPVYTRHWADVVLMLGQRRRRWTNIKTTPVQCLVFAGIGLVHYVSNSSFEWIPYTG